MIPAQQEDALLEKFSDTYFPTAFDAPIWLPHRCGAMLDFSFFFSIEDMEYALKYKIPKEQLLEFNDAIIEHGKKTGETLTLEKYMKERGEKYGG